MMPGMVPSRLMNNPAMEQINDASARPTVVSGTFAGRSGLRFSQDGRYLVYATSAAKANDSNGVSDVWLYNVGSTPAFPPWLEPDARAKMPFANPEAYCDQRDFAANVQPEDFALKFDLETEPAKALIFIRGALHAIVGPAKKPGHCRLATLDGPLALTMPSDGGAT